MRIINLVENTEGASGCGVEHGLCFYIEKSSTVCAFILRRRNISFLWTPGRQICCSRTQRNLA